MLNHPSRIDGFLESYENDPTRIKKVIVNAGFPSKREANLFKVCNKKVIPDMAVILGIYLQ